MGEEGGGGGGGDKQTHGNARMYVFIFYKFFAKHTRNIHTKSKEMV